MEVGKPRCDHESLEACNAENVGCRDVNLTFNDAKAQAIQEFEKRYLSQLLRESGGNVTQAAKRAGKERRALGKLIKKHGIKETTGSADCA